jgi:hypothetical protein
MTWVLPLRALIPGPSPQGRREKSPSPAGFTGTILGAGPFGVAFGASKFAPGEFAGEGAFFALPPFRAKPYLFPDP